MYIERKREREITTSTATQAHALSVPARSRSKPQTAGSQRGVLSALLAAESDALNVPPPAALIGLEVVKRFGKLGDFVGTVRVRMKYIFIHIFIF